MENTDYSHLAGRTIINNQYSVNSNRCMPVIVEAIMVEYDMGITLKQVASSMEVESVSFGTICINGRHSPNKGMFEQFGGHYDEFFKYLVDCLENYKSINSEIVSRIINKPMAERRDGNMYCATGLPV